jgi:hypothetical protein
VIDTMAIRVANVIFTAPGGSRWWRDTMDACGSGHISRNKKAAAEQKAIRLEEFFNMLHKPVAEGGKPVLQLLAFASYRCARRHPVCGLSRASGRADCAMHAGAGPPNAP